MLRSLWPFHILLACSLSEIEGFRRVVNVKRHSSPEDSFSGLSSSAGADNAQQQDSQNLLWLGDEGLATGAIPHDISIDALHLNQVAAPQVNMGKVHAHEVGIGKLAAGDVAVGNADIGQIKVNDLKADGMDVQQVKARDIKLQHAGVTDLGISDVDAQGINVQRFEGADMNLTQARVNGLDVAHVRTDDWKIHGLDVRGSTEMTSVKAGKIEAENVSLDHADLRSFAVNDVAADDVKINGMDFQKVKLRNAGIAEIGIHDVDAHSMKMDGIAAENIIVDNETVRNVNLSRIDAEDVKIHGLDLQGSVAMQNVGLSKVVLGDIEFGPVRSLGSELYWYIVATKVLVVLFGLIAIMACLHLVFVVAKDFRKVDKDDNKSRAPRLTTERRPSWHLSPQFYSSALPGQLIERNPSQGLPSQNDLPIAARDIDESGEN